ncbi:myosin-3-like isoform X3 [Trichomycterus rosablanca]|uniref:myosin-3-like isoform X3 n=1 Tax=Trichomycterus rosablanca TaxID=2290929 RepID=UPI002F355782
MESSTDINTLRSMTKGMNDKLNSTEVVHESDSEVISVQLLEFKTNLLEAVEELHICRDAEKRHETQICKLVLEKQELEWQMESLHSQINTMTNEHSEALAALKKQFQANIRGIEGEKGKHQLSAELKDKEISSLKEELKSLQLFKYSLEKKLSELEQKLQLQTQARDSHLNQLGEVEKRFGMISRQCAVVKQAHEKLEQNVDEAIRLNKKLVLINSNQESTIAALKEEVEKLNSKLVKGKVSSICKSGEDSSYFLLKDQQLQELKQRLIVETDLNKKLRNENAVERAEKQELMSSLQHAQWLLQTQTQAVSRAEQQLLIHTEEYQVLKREHEIVQERSKEKEDRLVQLIEEHKNSNITLKKGVQILQAKMRSDHMELKAVKVAYDNLHEKHRQLSSNIVQQARHIHITESGGSSQDNSEQARHHKEDKDALDERTAGCHKAIIGGGNDQTETSDGISMAEVTNQEIDPTVKHETSVGKGAPVQCISDNVCSSSTLQTYTGSCLAELSESETRSVYGATSELQMPELSDRPEERSCVLKMLEQETSDKHTCETAQDSNWKSQTVAPEMNRPPSASPNGESKLCNKEQATFEENNPQITLQDDTYQISIKNKDTSAANSHPQQQIVSEQQDLNEIDVSMSGATSFSATTTRRPEHKLSQLQNDSKSGNPDQHSTLEDINNIDAIEANPLPEAENNISCPNQSSSQCAFNLPGDLTGNKKDDKDTSAQMLTDQQNADTYTGPQILNPQEDLGPSSTDTPAKQPEQPNETEPSCCDDSKKYRSSSELTASPKETVDTQSGYEKSVPNVKQIERLDDFPALTRSPTLEKNSLLPSDFQELLTSLHIPVFPRPRPQNRGSTVIAQPLDKLSVCSIHPKRKSDHQGEWKAIKQTFSDTLSDEELRVPISFGSAQPGSPPASSVGNGLRQNCTFTPAPQIHSLGKVSRLVCKEKTPTPFEREDHQQSDIRAQIAKIDKFLSSEALMLSKRRRIDELEVSKP